MPTNEFQSFDDYALSTACGGGQCQIEANDDWHPGAIWALCKLHQREAGEVQANA